LVLLPKSKVSNFESSRIADFCVEWRGRARASVWTTTDHAATVSSVRSKRGGREGGGVGQAQFAQVDDISLHGDTVGFTLSQCDVSLANALRRILIAEVRRRCHHTVAPYRIHHTTPHHTTPHHTTPHED
jgi:hypothetical protein